MINQNFYKDIGGKGMLAIAFDFDTKKIKEYYSGSKAAAYREMGEILEGYGFKWIQGSTYVCDNINPFEVCIDISEYLKSIYWIKMSIKSFYVFEMKSFSNLTDFVDGTHKPRIPVKKAKVKRIK